VISGQKCRITVDGRTVYATVFSGSDNKHSLMLESDSAIWIGGVMYAGNIALLWVEEKKTYIDLITGVEVNLEWVQS
jgi:hypothetical protein